MTWRRAARPSYPISDHCDGARFFNPGPAAPPRDLRQVIRWQWRRSERATWPSHVVDPAYPPPPAAVADDTAAISFVNHATFFIRLPGLAILTDPIFSERCSPLSFAGPRRVRAPGIALHALPPPDLILLSHNHYDHMDLPSLRVIRDRHRPRVVTLLGNARPLARQGIDATELDWWDSVTVGAARITATPARHFSARTPFDRNRALWGGFMIQTGAARVLFAGDSGAGPHWRDIRDRLGPPDVALLPIGAYEPRWFMAPVHMNPAEAVQAHRDLGAACSLGMHFGTFQLTDEAIDAPIEALRVAREDAGLAPHHFAALGFGQTRVYATGAGPASSGTANGMTKGLMA